jgi:HK97 family phage prohead protease
MKNNIISEAFFDSSNISVESHTIPVILSEETKVLRYNWDDGAYDLILDHSEESVNLGRKDILPVLLQHNTEMLPIGIYENVRLEDGKLKATARFDSEDELAMQVFGKMKRGFMQSLSVGINIHKTVLEEKENENGRKTYRATKWEITEASIVTVPAIPGARVGMSLAEVEDKLDMGGNETAMPTASSDKLANSNLGVSMEFNETNFNILLESREHLNGNIAKLNTIVEEKTSALEASETRLAEATQKLSEAEAGMENYKNVVTTRLSEAKATGVDMDTALAMLDAETDEDASKIALDSKSNTSALNQGEGEPSEKSAILAWAEQNKGSIR